ncbi:hypothetical protein BJ741DRAFT_712205 [Chytriomyces cf. hyalinus JEL632]|nr:hypothetical protein BJ741DRAFT_712205 [Chytriomyces cf. hyalinus JEL632]
MNHVAETQIAGFRERNCLSASDASFAIGFQRPPLNSINHLHCHVTSAPIRPTTSWLRQPFGTALTPPVLSKILERVPVSERDEMKRLLGEVVTEQVSELRNEAEMLAQIASEYHNETQLMVESGSGQVDPLLSYSSFQWNALNQRIHLLLSNLELKGDAVALTDADHSVVDYVRLNGGGHVRRTLPNNTAGHQTLVNLLKLLGIQQYVDYVQLPQVIQELKSAVLEERDGLLGDIDRLHESLDEERGLRTMAEKLGSVQKPSVNDLQRVKDALESKCSPSDSRGYNDLHLPLPGSLSEQAQPLYQQCGEEMNSASFIPNDEINQLKKELEMLELDSSFCSEFQSARPHAEPPPQLPYQPPASNARVSIPSRQSRSSAATSTQASTSSRAIVPPNAFRNNISETPAQALKPSGNLRKISASLRNGILLEPLVETMSNPRFPDTHKPFVPSPPLVRPPMVSIATFRSATRASSVILDSAGSSTSLDGLGSVPTSTRRYTRKMRVSTVSSADSCVDSGVGSVKAVSPL